MSWTSLWGNWPSSWAAAPGAIMESAPASAASTPVPCQGCGWASGAPRPPTPCRPTCWAGSPRPSRSCSLCCWTGPLTCSWTTSESGARGPPSARDATATAAGPALPCPAPTPQPRPQSRQACCAAAFIQLSQRRTGPEVASQARRRSSRQPTWGAGKLRGG